MKTQLTPEQQKRADELSQMSPEEWDTVCKQCGVCCLSKVRIYNAKVAYLKRCCDKFDLKTHKCSVYKSRLDGSKCIKINMDVILNTDLLPASCGYIEYIFGKSKYSVNPDFSIVKPIYAEYKYESIEQFTKDVFEKSVLWNERGR